MKPVQVLGGPAMRLTGPGGAQATVLLHGAQVVSWIPAGDVERLYLSPLAVSGGGQSVRGGVPVIFPQFEQRGALPRHGLVRDRSWQWLEGAERDGAMIGVLRLTDDEQSRALWPHRFEAELTVSLERNQLDIELAIVNTGDAPFDFTAALHTYLRCDDVLRAKLHGLFGTEYIDKLSGRTQRQEIDPMSFVGEIDRIYVDLPGRVSLATALGRTHIAHNGFPDAVVWNPGPDKPLPDLPPEGWREMLCVEAGRIAKPVVLAPGQEWAARQSLSV
ncbi:MAG: D-hexose-6-phosphate mutarotase [Burkholderiales bacterium]|nr:D-hexose-6-phosphate mutarotase [Burkholderiales bacterium]